MDLGPAFSPYSSNKAEQTSEPNSEDEADVGGKRKRPGRVGARESDLSSAPKAHPVCSEPRINKVNKVKRTGDALARQVEEAMQQDLMETTNSLTNFVTVIGKPYQETAEDRVKKLSGTLDELTAIERRLETLQIEIQNLHVSR